MVCLVYSAVLSLLDLSKAFAKFREWSTGRVFEF